MKHFPEDPLAAKIAWLMDHSIRIGPWSIGFDGLIGLIPGLGDVTAGAISTLIIARAMQRGVSRAAILRMVINVGIDSLLGSIPFIGDLFDFAYKSNSKNVEIYRKALREERHAVKDWSFVIFVFLLLAVLISIPIFVLVFVARSFMGGSMN